MSRSNGLKYADFDHAYCL